jgi:dTDP-4-dehydrorhamnose reductase
MKIKILILGINGMLGHKLWLRLNDYERFNIYGTARSRPGWLDNFDLIQENSLYFDLDAYNLGNIDEIISDLKPDWVINCIGIIKHKKLANNHRENIYLNSLLPHQLAQICESSGSRLLHISTDCVFSGDKGNYSENDLTDARDLYGRCKALGEVDYPNCLTLRTSIIGHEIQTRLGLLEWFLAQVQSVRGYINHIYTGFPTDELADIIAEYVIPNPHLSGIYNLSSDPISKFGLLKLIAQIYKKEIDIEPYEYTPCNRSLDSSRLRRIIAYHPPAWPEMIRKMHRDYINSPLY